MYLLLDQGEAQARASQAVLGTSQAVLSKVTEGGEFMQPVLADAVKMAGRALAVMPEPAPEPAPAPEPEPPTPEQYAAGAAAARSARAAGNAQRDVPRAPAARSASAAPPPQRRAPPRSKPAARPPRGKAPAAARPLPRATAPTGGPMTYVAAREQLEKATTGNRFAGTEYNWLKSVEALQVNPNPKH